MEEGGEGEVEEGEEGEEEESKAVSGRVGTATTYIVGSQ